MEGNLIWPQIFKTTPHTTGTQTQDHQFIETPHVSIPNLSSQRIEARSGPRSLRLVKVFGRLHSGVVQTSASHGCQMMKQLYRCDEVGLQGSF